MRRDPEVHHRRSIRLKGYDYRQAGAYFVTICAWHRECLFGQVLDGEMRLSRWGEIVQQEWISTSDIRQEIELDVFVVMPNHLHGIVRIAGPVGAHGRAPLLWRPPRSLGSLVAGYKSAATRRINLLRASPGAKVWQRGYYEHIVRDGKDLDRIRRYVLSNPAHWEEDEYHPSVLCKEATP
jgi:REP element-mobilizing transposase RayT